MLNTEQIKIKDCKKLTISRYHEWQEDVFKLEGIKKWKIINTKYGGGFCQYSTKTIWAKELNSALFLHEVAHILTPKEFKFDKTGHTAIWGDKYTWLVNRYLRIF